MEKVTIQTTVNAPLDVVWELWTGSRHIEKWNSASDDWHTTRNENDLRVGGKFVSRMEAKDGSVGFDFSGVYLEIIEQKKIVYKLADERKVEIDFDAMDDTTTINESFETDNQHSVEIQKDGWQAILDSFKKYTEANMKK